MYKRCHCKKMCPCKEETLEDLCDDIDNMTNQMDMCECGFEEDDNLFPKNPMFGQSYVPWQVMDKTFLPKVGLQKGTIFPELVNPYVPCQSMEEIAFIEANNKIGEGCNKCQMN